MTPTVSVVLPVFNEQENLPLLKERLLPVLQQAAEGSFEVLFVDDGSTDGSLDMLEGFHADDKRLKVISLSRNFGHQAALQAGLDSAHGQAVVLMDSDLQDPPEVISRLVDRWRQGYQVVYAVRRKRKEGLLWRGAYGIFYRTIRPLAEIDIPLDAGDFCLLDRRIVDTLVGLRERNRFLRGLRSWVGFSQIGVEYERQPRHAGSAKYTLRKLVELALSGYVGFSSVPLRITTLLGLFTATAGFLLALWVVVTKLLDIPIPRGWASILASVLGVGGIQLLMLGIIGEYLGRVYDEVRDRPLYIVQRKTGFEN